VIANAAVEVVRKLCKHGAKIADLCTAGDDYVKEAVSKIYKSKKSMKKGIAFPTCMSPNSVVGHYSPLATDPTILREGDNIKIDLGCQIDGFASVVALTVLVGKEGEKEEVTTGPGADCFIAAHTCGELALRMLRPGAKTKDIAEKINAMSQEFGVNPVVGVCSHDVKRFLLDGEKVILPQGDAETKAGDFEIKPYESYIVDIVMSTGEGKPKEVNNTATTVFMRNAGTTYSLKMQASRKVLSEVNERFPNFPFTLREFGDEAAKIRLGIKECITHGLLSPYPALCEKEGETVCHLKFSVAIMPNGPLKVSGVPLDLSKFNSDKKVKDEELVKLLAQSVSTKKKKKKNKKKVSEAKAAV